MKHFSKLIILAACVFAASMAQAKHKEDCHKSGGKWMPGSATDAEVGACWFLIKAGPKDTNPHIEEGAITPDACQKQRGKISKDGKQCSIEFSKSTSVVIDPNSQTNSAPQSTTRTMPAPMETRKGKPQDLHAR